METFWQDAKYALRSLQRSPGFVAVAVLSLALGIGANTAIFSVVDAVLLRPLPYADPEKLVMVWEEASFAGFPRNTPAPANYADWKAQNRVFQDVAATEGRTFNITGDGEPERIAARGVTANFFSLLGVSPILGRTFLPEEDEPGAGRVVVLSHTLWQNRYGRDRGVLGRKILLNGEPYAVVGVMPAGFQFRDDERLLWVPIAFTPQDLAVRSGHYLNVVARLKPGVSMTQAREDIAAITRRIARENPNFAARLGSVVIPLREELTGTVSAPLRMVQGAVALVLLIACANLASLQLSRGNARRKEIAVRAALGSGRVRIIRQLVTESMLLSLAGGLAGLLLAWWSFAFLRQLIPPGLTQFAALTLNVPVLGFTVGVCLAAGLLFGLAPALQASKSNLGDALKQGDLRGGLSASGNRLRNAMVIAEVALALVLLVGAGLMVRTVHALHSQYAALQPERLLALRTQLSPTRYADHARRVAFYDQVLERVRALPGIVSAAYTTSLPLDWRGGTNGFEVEGRPTIPGLAYDANYRFVTPGYFQTVGIPLREGRAIDDRDGSATARVVMVNETMARSYWPGESAIGRRFALGAPVQWNTIIGVVADVRQMGMSDPVKAEMYFPHRQPSQDFIFQPRDLVLRTTAEDPMTVVASVREQIFAVDAEQPISNVRTLADLMDGQSAPRRLGMVLLTLFAALALLLAAVGIYGVLAYFVNQHTREIGVRLALGARPADILNLVIGKGMGLVSAGIAMGLAGAFALSRWIASLLFGVSPTDMTTFFALPLALALFALLACYLPARRAARVDPMTALRYE